MTEVSFFKHQACLIGECALTHSSSTHRHVIPIMAPLTHCLEVIVATVFRHMIEMRDRQDDFAASDRMRFVVQRIAASIVIDATFARAFATILRPLEANAETYSLPVLRVSGAIFRSDWHLPPPQNAIGTVCKGADQEDDGEVFGRHAACALKSDMNPRTLACVSGQRRRLLRRSRTRFLSFNAETPN